MGNMVKSVAGYKYEDFVLVKNLIEFVTTDTIDGNTLGTIMEPYWNF